MFMIRNDFLAKIAGFGFFYRWHPEVALRYLPIIDEIRRSKNSRILEVGSGGMGITPYLRRKVTGVDTKFYPPYHHLLKQVTASAMKLPFRDNSFDMVFSVDMLEHLKKKDRGVAIKEMIRVSNKKVIIGIPCGKIALNQDIELNNYFQKLYKKSYPFLEEQINFGLPEKSDIHDTIISSAKVFNKQIKITIIGNENLWVRKMLMKAWMIKNGILNLFLRKFLLLTLPILKKMNTEPTYRQIFIIDIKDENSF